MVCRPACHKSLAGVDQLMTNPDLENGKLAPCALLLLRQPSMGPHLCQNDVCGIVGCRCAATSMKSNINSFIALHYINVRDVSGGVCVLRPSAPAEGHMPLPRARHRKLHHCVAARATLRKTLRKTTAITTCLQMVPSWSTLWLRRLARDGSLLMSCMLCKPASLTQSGTPSHGQVTVTM